MIEDSGLEGQINIIEDCPWSSGSQLLGLIFLRRKTNKTKAE